MIRIFALVIALFSGGGLTWSLLAYHGKEPVNVFTFLWVLLVPQVLLLSFLLLSAFLHKLRIMRSFRVIYPMTAMLVNGLLRKIGRFAERRLDAGRANRIREIHALLGKTRTIYGSVFFWPIFLLLQFFGIFFNIGVLGALLVKVTITDLAFGWQTTLQLAPETVLEMVKIIASPWSWLFSPPVAHPTITQISGSQMILKEGIYHLATADLAAWWPFIFLTVFFYALVPRLILSAAGSYLKRKATDSLDFAHGECDRLIMRMKTPEVDTVSEPYRVEENVKKTAVSQAADDHEVEPLVTSAILMVPEEIFDSSSNSRIEKKLHDTLGMQTAAVISAKINASRDIEQLSRILSERQGASGTFRTVIVQEAWQPPIKENIQWIKSLRNSTKNKIGMIIALVGKPVGGDDFAPPSDSDKTIWKQAINSLGDPYIRVESLGT